MTYPVCSLRHLVVVKPIGPGVRVSFYPFFVRLSQAFKLLPHVIHSFIPQLTMQFVKGL